VRANQLRDISQISNLTHLNYLAISGNDITDAITIGTLTGLTYLWCDNNRITDISPISGLTSMVNLNVANNGLASIEALRGMTHLAAVVLDSNHVYDLSPLSGKVTIQDLSARFNTLSDISPLSDLTGLFALDVGDNLLLSDITAIGTMTALGIMVTDSCRITVLPRGLADLRNLRYLNIRQNGIQDIQVVVQNAINGGIGHDTSDHGYWFLVHGNPLNTVSQDTYLHDLHDRNVNVDDLTPGPSPEITAPPRNPLAEVRRGRVLTY
jgi:internalin A